MHNRRLPISVLTTEARDDYGYHDPQTNQLIEFLRNKPETCPLDDCLRDIYRYPTFYGLEYLAEGVRVIKGETIVEGELADNGEMDFISPEDAARFPRTILEEGDLVMSVRGTVGKAAVVPSEFAGSIINANLIRMQLKDKVDPYYLHAYLTSRVGQTLIERQTTKAIQSTITVPYIKAIPVWLPNKDTMQCQIAQTLQDAYQERRKLLQTVDELQQTFDSYLKSKLAIKEENVIDEPRFRVKTSSLRRRHDVEFFQPKNYSLQALLKSVGARRLNEVFTYSSETRDPTKNPLETFDYVGIASIDVHLGNITAPMKIVGEFAPSRARRVIRKGNRLVSTVRPTRGAIAIVPVELDDQICSTGFAVLEPKDEVEPLFLHSMLRMDVVRQQFGRFATGASYPAIIKSDMNEVLLPFTEDKNLQREISEEACRRFQEASSKIAEADDLLDRSRREIEKLILGKDFSLDIGANEHITSPVFDTINA